MSSWRNSPASRSQAAVALVVTAVAGFVDAVGFLALYGIYTANMSGNSVNLGIEIFYARWDLIFRYGWPVAAFTVGLFVAAALLELGNRKGVRRIAGIVLGLEAFFLALFVIFAQPLVRNGQVHATTFWSFYATIALPAIAMGIQDATVTRVGGLSVRTTHVTGSIVHFAAAASSYLFWLRDRTFGRGGRRLVWALRISSRQPFVHEAAAMSALWVGYLAGAVCGTGLKSAWELNSLVVPIAMLAILVLFDVFRPPAITKIEGQKPR